jgi:hypothetical protein
MVGLGKAVSPHVGGKQSISAVCSEAGCSDLGVYSQASGEEQSSRGSSQVSSVMRETWGRLEGAVSDRVEARDALGSVYRPLEGWGDVFGWGTITESTGETLWPMPPCLMD